MELRIYTNPILKGKKRIFRQLYINEVYKMSKNAKPKTLNEEERLDMLNRPNKNAPTGFRNYCMMQLMLNCGLRISEVTLNTERKDGEVKGNGSLRLDHIDFLRKKIMIRDAKGSKDRIVWVDNETLDDLDKWIDWRGDLIESGRMKKPADVDEKYEGLIFVTFNGTPVKHSYMRKTIKKYAKEVGVLEWKKVSPHTLRHTFATDLYRETNNLRKVQEALGHSSSKTTEIYTHIADEELRKDMQNLRRNGE